MTFAGQLLHLMRADLRHTRWWWCAYLALLVLSALLPFVQPLPSLVPAGVLGLVPFISWLSGMALVIVTVQADAPLCVTAFWHGKPIDERALGTAKLLVIGAAVTLAALIALVVWHLLGMPRSSVPQLLAQGVSFLLAMLMVAALFGALTRTLGAALLWITGFLVVLLVLLPVAFLWGRDLAASFGFVLYAASAFALMAFGSGVYLLQALYRRAGARPTGARMLVGAAATGIVLGPFVMLAQSFAQLAGPKSNPNTIIVTADAPLRMPETVRFDTVPRLQRAGGSIAFVVVSARPDRRYELQQVRLTPMNRIGISGMFVTPFSTPLAITAPALALDTTWNWMTSDFEGTTHAPDRGLVFGNLAVSADMDTVRSIALEGTLIRYRAELVARMPFDLGVIHRDTQTTVTLQRRGDGALMLTWPAFQRQLDYESLARGTSPLARRLVFVVLDSAGHTARRLSSTSHAQTSEWLVLPGASRQHHMGVLDAQSAIRSLVGRKGTALLVYRWVEEGRSRVRQVIAVDDWPRRSPGRPSSTVMITEDHGND